MKRLYQLLVAAVLMCALALSASAGEMLCPISQSPPSVSMADERQNGVASTGQSPSGDYTGHIPCGDMTTGEIPFDVTFAMVTLLTGLLW
jgi:hypothetical protein